MLWLPLVYATSAIASGITDPRDLFPPTCPNVSWSVWWQVVDLGLAPDGDDLTVPWADAVQATDDLLDQAFPDGRGVLILGESHRMAGTHNFVKALLRASEKVDCLLLEHPAWHQSWINEFVAGAPCEESWGIAERYALRSDDIVCRRDLRFRMLKVASRTATPVYAVDTCYSCPPVSTLLENTDSVFNGMTSEDFSSIMLEMRNRYMAHTTAGLFEEDRCSIGVLLAGRAHVRVPEGFTERPTRTLSDEFATLDIPTMSWPVFDVDEELRGFRNPRPELVRFARQHDEVVAVYLETPD